ncbi:MAG: ABC transporter ATP-binding protein/permease [Francisellaceae bacterium]|jgi:ATP-binding cassette, subfamily B, heavy metal transporter|nr:ABC transporter ATP-binding protein/permease [Francisellaceae bacterium]
MDKAKHLPSLGIISKFIPLIWPKGNYKIKFHVIMAIILVMVTIGLNISVPLIFREIITNLSVKSFDTERTIISLIICYGLLWSFSQFTQKFREMVLFGPINNVITRYSLKVFNHLHLLNLHFHLDKETGKITSAINKAQLAIAMAISNILFRMLPVIIEIVLSFGILWYLYDISYGLILLGVLALFFFYNLHITKLFVGIQQKASDADISANSRIVDSILNSETVKYYNTQKTEYKKAEKLLLLSSKANIKSFGTIVTLVAIQTLIIGSGLAILSYKAGAEILVGTMKVGDFVLINGYLLQLFHPLQNLSDVSRDTFEQLSKIEYSARLLENSNIIHNTKGAPDIKVNHAHIVFNKVDFSYAQNLKIIKEVSFDITPGTMTAIVGPSGSGKSTISKLLLRYCDINKGSIKIDGQDIKEVTQESVRQVIGVVPQDVILFNNTLRFNLTYGNFDATDDEINNVIHLVHLDKFVSQLDGGLESQVGEGGLKISGGERQRVGIARALLKNPKILLFDEATSSLDTKIEKSIQENIQEVAKGTTSIIIAHRLSTITHANKIIVMNDGEIIQSGSHKDLINQDGLYATLWDTQKNKGKTV